MPEKLTFMNVDIAVVYAVIERIDGALVAPADMRQLYFFIEELRDIQGWLRTHTSGDFDKLADARNAAPNFGHGTGFDRWDSKRFAELICACHAWTFEGPLPELTIDSDDGALLTDYELNMRELIAGVHDDIYVTTFEMIKTGKLVFDVHCCLRLAP